MAHETVSSDRGEKAKRREEAGRPFPLAAPWRRLTAAPPRPTVAPGRESGPERAEAPGKK